MPVQFDEYGIPVKQKSQPEVDDYGIPIKKKVGGNGNGSISETPPNPFLAAKRPIGIISNAQVLEAKQGIGAAQNRSTEQQIAAGKPLQREILSDKGSWTREQVNQAAINTADKYFENNPELTFSLNKLKKDNNISLKNVPIKEEDKFSVKSLKNTTAYQRKVAEIKKAFDEGNLALTKFQSGEKSGEAVFTRPAKFLRGIGQGIEGSFGMTKDAVISMISDDKEFADYLDKQQRNLPEIPTEAPRGISNEIGMQVGSLIKPMAEFGVGAAITSETGGWGGFVALAADAIPSRTTAKTKELYFEKIAQLQEKYGENIPEEERIKAMKEARSDAPLQAIPEEAMEMYMFGRGTQALGTTPTGLSAFKKSLEKAGVEIPKMGLLGGAEEAASLGISRLQGNEVHDAGKKIGQAIEDWAAMEAAFKVVHGVINSPKYLRSSAKEALSEHPEVEVKLTEEAVAQGWITKEQADIVQADLEQYNRIRSTLPDDLPSDKAAAVTGLLQRNETLEQQKKTRNEIFHDEIDAEIANNTTKAKQILNSSQPLKYETDELTGDRGQDVGGRPYKEDVSQPIELSTDVPLDAEIKVFANQMARGEVPKTPQALEFYDNNRKAIENELRTIAEKESKKETEITPEETDVRVTAVDERKPTDEGSKTEKDIREDIQPQQEKDLEAKTDIEKRRQQEINDIFNRNDVKILRVRADAAQNATALHKGGNARAIVIAKAEQAEKAWSDLTDKYHDEINAKYDAELAKLESKSQPEIDNLYKNKKAINIEGDEYELAQLNTHGEGNVFVIEKEGEEIGRATLSKDGNYFENIRIDEKYRRKGLASKMYDYVESRMGIEMQPSPIKQSVSAQKLWEKRNLQKQVATKINAGVFAKSLNEALIKGISDYKNQTQKLIELENKYFIEKGITKEEFEKLSTDEKNKIREDAKKWLAQQPKETITPNKQEEVIQQQNISEPINTKQDAIQKPTTTEKVLRNESKGEERNVGLRPMEQGNKPKVVAKKEKETVNTKDKDVPLSEKESEPIKSETTKPISEVKEPTKEQTIKETVSEDIKSDSGIGAETKPTVLEPPKGKYETKANEIADKIRKTELPSWLSSKDPNIKKQGIGADEMKELLAQAVIKMGKLLDGTKEFSKAAREAVQDLVKALGQEREEEIVKGFSDYYNEQTGNKPKQEPLDDLVSVQYPPTQLSHGGTERIRGEFGGEEAPIKEEGSFLKWEKEANDKIDEGFNTNKLLDRMENEDYRPSEVEHIILTKQADALAQKLRDIGKTKGIDSKEFDATLEQIDRINRLSDIAGSKEGKGLVARRFRTINDDSLVGFLLQEKELNKGAPLTENQKKTAINEFEAIKAAKEEYQAKFEKLQADYAKLLAEREVKKQAAAKKITKKTHEDFVKERKDIAQSIKEKLKKARGETTVTVIPYANELIAIAPDVAKLAKSLIEEGVIKLEEVVKNIHNTLKEDIPDITEKDVQDIIAGNYNEKKKTRGQVAEQMQNLRTQAKLINKYEAMLKGEQPKTEKDKIKFNQEIHDLRQKIKGLEKEESEANKFYGESDSGNRRIEKMEDELQRLKERRPKEPTQREQRELSQREKELKEQIAAERKLIAEEQREFNKRSKEEFDPELKKLQALKKRNETELKKVEEQLRTGDVAVPLKKVALSVDNELKKNFPQAYKEALESRDKLIKAKHERMVRRAEKEFDNLDKYEKFKKKAARWLNVPRTLMASFDFSAPLRQAAVATTAHPFSAARAARQMFKHGWSQKAYDRWFEELKESPNYDLMKESKLAITDPYNLHLEKLEEDFLGGNIAEKFPLGIGRGVKASERAYVSYLNKMRIDLFNRYAEQFMDNGKTFQNSPELYKSLANFINASTGRGKLGGDKLEAAAPILNSLLFSPRLIASRMNLLTNWANPNFYRKVPYEVRKLYFQDMAKFIGVGITTLYLAKQLGADVELDPRSSDFGKIRIGDTRYDIWGGFQQYVRVFAQIFSGDRKTELGIKDLDETFGESRAEVAESFARGKLAPIPAMVMDIASGRTSAGEKVNKNFQFPNPENETSFTEMAIGHLSPLLIQDVIKASKEDGIKSIFTTGVPAMFGIGVQNYDPSKTARQFDLKDTDWQFLLQKTGRLPLLNESQYTLVDESGKRRDMTEKEKDEFTKLRNQKIKDAIKSLRENGALLFDVDGNVTEVKAAKDMTNEEVKKWVEPITSRATAEAKSELFGDNVDLDKIKIETNE